MNMHLNPNTVQQAYMELNRKNVIFTQNGKGEYVSDEALRVIQEECKKYLADLRPVIRRKQIKNSTGRQA